MINIKKPYRKALAIPFFLLADLLVKKDTVRGIIGKVQGIRSPIKPPTKPRIKMPSGLLDLLSSASVPPHLFMGLSR